MSITERTVIDPSEIMGSGSMTLSTHSDVAEGFRGIFMPLTAVTNGPKNWLYPNRANLDLGSWDYWIDRRGDSGPPDRDDLDVYATQETGAGKYGDDCIGLNCEAVVVSFAQDSDTVTSVGHPFVNGDQLVVTELDGDIPPEIDPVDDFANGTKWFVVQSTTNAFKLANSVGGSAVTFTGTGGTHIVAGRYGLPGCWFDTGDVITQTGYPPNNKSFRPGQTTGTEKFLAQPSAGPFNRVEFLLKFPSGYRDTIGGDGSTDRNYIVGTYHATESHAGWEYYNNHYYFHIHLRHDQRDGEWFTVQLSDSPSHIRSGSAGTVAEQPPNPSVLTHSVNGGFWDSCTKLYIDPLPYAKDPELTGEYVSLVDRIRMFYIAPKYQISVTWDSLDATERFAVRPGEATDYAFAIENTGAASVDVRLVLCAGTAYSTQVLDSSKTPVSHTSVITLEPDTPWAGYYRFNSPSANIVYQTQGVAVVPTAEYNGDPSTGSLASWSDSAVERRSSTYDGPLDAETYGVACWPEMYWEVTFDGATDLVESVFANRVVNGQQIQFELIDGGDTMPTGLSAETTYWVLDRTSNAFKVEATEGGGAIDFAGNGSATSGKFWLKIVPFS